MDVVSIALDVPRDVLEVRACSLSPDERERAARFRFDRDRDRFVACRGAVRALIASRLSAAPSSLAFRYGRHGKPELPESARAAIAFNVSHSGDLALCAIAEVGPLGVDVERVRELPDLDSVAGGFFSPGEREFIRGRDRDASETDGGRAERFFRLWTLKEAWLKAEGEGLAGPLTDFEIIGVRGRDPKIRAVAGRRGRGDADAGRRGLESWALRSFRPSSGFVAALAARSRVRLSFEVWRD